MSKTKLPSLLSITGAIDPSHAIFFSSSDKNTKNGKPLSLKEITVLGTLSSYGEQSKTDDVPAGNIQKIDSCFLPSEHNYLHVKGNIKFSNQIESVNANSTDYIKSIKEIYANYCEENNFKELIDRYLIQLFNGSVLFRNKYSSDIVLKLIFNSKSLEIDVNQRYMFSDIDSLKSKYPEINEVESFISKAFSGKEDDVFILEYEYITEMGFGQEVYPSQEFMESKKDNKGKVLFETIYNGQKITGLHSQKVGNALRTIDTWFSEESSMPIPVDPFGPDKKNGCFRRGKNKKSIFDILPSIVDKKLNDEEIDYNSGELHYLIASILRGGVYSGAGKGKG